MKEGLFKVCVIDDDLIHVFTTKKLLKSIGFEGEIIVYNNGLDAINGLSEINDAKDFPQIIFLDINMPVMDGWGFIQNFETKVSNYSLGKVYMVTSSIDPEDKKKSKQYKKIEELVSKPFTSKKLEEILC